ncbi:hypothetical protein BYT27DRAFT_6508772 [Phlegmacium glaucopus]|nr:hypothetical protein BYT27DRAFT_6508772 [Phlegmacium glaucopus]
MQWSFNHLNHGVILLFSFFTSQILAFHIPIMARKSMPRMCLTNVTLSPYPEPCRSTCEPILHIQKRCQDMIPCMCQHVKPFSMSECVQCIRDAAGDLLLHVPGYLNETIISVSAYTNICSSISEEIQEVEAIPAVRISHSYDQPGTLPSLRTLFPMRIIVVACIVLIILLFYK